MSLQEEKFLEIARPPLRHAAEGELRREGEILFVGAGLPVRETLETVFDSDCQAAIPLFIFRFADEAAFSRSEALVRAIKKNFRGYLLGRFETPLSHARIEEAYAGGIDLLEIPLPVSGRDPFLTALDLARTVFPRWSVIASLAADDLAPVQADIDLLFDRGILPLPVLTPAAAGHPPADLARLYGQLQACWRRHRGALRPLLPLLQRLLPLPPPHRRGIGGLFDKVEEVQLRTASDLRRLLRVRQVEESFESAGL